jgi:hypothetical protein
MILKVLIVLSFFLLTACQSVKSVVASTSVQPTHFLNQPHQLTEQRQRAPFLAFWQHPSLQQTLQHPFSLYIAPIRYDEIRPPQRAVSNFEFSLARRHEKLPTLAAYARNQFIKAFRSRKNSICTLVDHPSPDALTLHINWLEWEPNTLSGLLIRETIDLFTLPGVGSLISKPSRGRTAIEAKLTLPKSNQSILEFADREESKSCIILFAPNELFASGQAKQAFKQWANQFVKLLESPPTTKISDPSPIIIWGL